MQYDDVDVALPGGGTLALVTLDNGFDHTKPTTFGPLGVAELRGQVGGDQLGLGLLADHRLVGALQLAEREAGRAGGA